MKYSMTVKLNIKNGGKKKLRSIKQGNYRRNSNKPPTSVLLLLLLGVCVWSGGWAVSEKYGIISTKL